MRRYTAVLLRWLMCGLIVMPSISCVHTQTVPQDERSTLRYTLAVLPWNMSGNRIDESWSYGKSALTRVLATSVFKPVASYYDLDNEPTTRIQAHDIGVFGTLWPQPDGSSAPDVAVAFALGEHLGVDAALMYAMDPRRGTDYIAVWLLDVPRRRTYARRDTTVTYEREAVRVLAGMTRHMFARFLKERQRTGPP